MPLKGDRCVNQHLEPWKMARTIRDEQIERTFGKI